MLILGGVQALLPWPFLTAMIITENYRVTWNFHDMLILWFDGLHILQHLNFANILQKFWSEGYFNFVFLS